MTFTRTTTLTSDHITTTPTAADDRTPLMLGSLGALLLANGMQIAAALAKLDVSPPVDVLPLLAATMAIGIAAIPLVRAGQRQGLVLGLVFCALSLIGMGPHKLFLENGTVIGPLALTGFAFEIAFARTAIRSLRDHRERLGAHE